MRARASASRGVGPSASAVGWCAPCAVRLGTGYWLPRCLAGGGPEPFQAPGAVRRDSSPSKTPHLQVWTPLTRPDRRRRGGRSLSRPRRSSGFLSWGFKDAPPSISARCVRSRRGPPRGGSPSAREMPSPQRLPPLPFFPASTVCSAARLAGLCASRVLSDAVVKAVSSSSGMRFSCNRPWGSCRFGACRCAFVRRSTRYFGFPQCRSARIAGRKAAFAGASPVMPYPSELCSSSAAVPTVTGGRCPLAVTDSCVGRCVVANHDATSLASAGLRAFIRCRVRSAERLLPASPARCSPGLLPEEGGRSASARAERRSRQRAR